MKVLVACEESQRVCRRGNRKMDDLISRQAAIGRAVELPMFGKQVKVVAVSELEALPSAQSEIVRCCQCKYAEVADKEDAQDGYTCQFHRGSVWFSGSYCSWAERRTDG